MKCLSKSLAPLEITDILSDEIVNTEGKPVLVGGGTDGASVNIANHNGMKGIMLDSLVWSWCYAHHLELACKNALRSKLFEDVAAAVLPV